MGNESRGRKLGEKRAKGEEEIISRSHFSVFRLWRRSKVEVEEKKGSDDKTDFFKNKIKFLRAYQIMTHDKRKREG